MASRKTPSLRDFSKGRITKYSANTSLIPINSVSDSFNVNFDEIIGCASARKGTTGSTVASGKSPLGLDSFSGATNLLLSVFSGASNASVYYFDSSWHTSGLTSLNNSSECNFATLGGRSFIVNGVDAMKSSTDGNTWDTTNCITTDSVVPKYIYAFKARLLASGYPGFKDRIYFSSVIDPNASPTLTWSTNPSTGDWIDVNPDDNAGNVSGFSDASSVLLVFKKRAFYRVDTVALNVDTQPVYNAGAVSQKAITKCQGMVYFFSGDAIYSTNGGYPTQISRLGVQDYIDALPQSSWANVTLGADTWNVYVSLGQVTVNGLTNYFVLKFSTRDQSWSVHYYPVNYQRFTLWTDTNGTYLYGASTDGKVSAFNKGTSDNGIPIFYQADTQELEFGGRSTDKTINDKISVFTRYGQGSKLQVKEDENDWRTMEEQITEPITILENLNIKARYLKFRWSGTYVSGRQPVLEGFEFPSIKNEGILNNKIV